MKRDLAEQTPGNNPEPSIQQQLIGVWKLISLDLLVDGNVLHPYGDHPLGRLSYDDAGRISAQIMRPGRQSSLHDPDAISGSSADELQQIAEGYLGYYGAFTIDPENKTLIHHVEACSLPAWVGTNQKRRYEFDRPHLILTSGPNKLVWERLPDC